AYEAKAHKLNTNVNNFEAESSDDIDSLSACDELEDYDSDDGLPAHNELIENNDAENIVKKLQDAANKYYWECDSNQTRRLRYLGNSVRTKRRKKQQQHKAAKGTSTLHTFWVQKKSSEETSEAELYDDVDERLENERQLEKFDDEQLANKGWLEEVDENDIGE
ncbi:20360_t:CDS:2, partial [Cetraspora pellucida]